MMSNIDTGSGSVDYETVRMAMANEPFTMSLTDTDEVRAVIVAVNEGIDSYLEACFCPDRGDRFEGGKRKAGKLTLCRSLDCVVSVESLPTLLRRLSESDLGGDPDVQSAGSQLASDILMVLGINEYGHYVGKEMLV
jgi:hypothetical protein